MLVQEFCPLNIKITQFPDGFRLQTNDEIERQQKSVSEG